MRVVKASSGGLEEDVGQWFVLVNDTNYKGLHIKAVKNIYTIDGVLLWNRDNPTIDQAINLFQRQAKEKLLVIYKGKPFFYYEVEFLEELE